MKQKTLMEEYALKFKGEYTKALKAIKRYDRIAIFRHIMPDFDALGTQMGLATWIKDNFPEKEVRVLGDNHVTFTPRLYPMMDNLNDEWFKKPFLTIVVDVSSHKRIADPRYKKGKYKLIIDHHPSEEKIGSTVIRDTEAAAAAEIVVNMISSFKGNYKLSKEAARYFYTAIVGDSGSFKYSSTSAHTFEIAKTLVSAGIDIAKTVQDMFLKQIDDLKVTAYVLNNFSISEHGVAWYSLDLATQERLKITTERGKENVNVFANIEGINAWC
jgi:phosphoesterase RecJ-like protein